jgi:hypothetical protein
MILGHLQLRCRMASVLALASMIFYAVLLPWHTVSQATSQLAQSAAPTSQPPCHEGAPVAKHSLPSKPPTNCPICKGFGTLHLAAGAPSNFVVIGIAETEASPATVVEGIAHSTWHAPQSRGPPGFFA